MCGCSRPCSAMPSACTADPACTGAWKPFGGRRSACTPSPRRRAGPRSSASSPASRSRTRCPWRARSPRSSNWSTWRRNDSACAICESARRAGTCRRRSGTRSRSPRSSRRIRPRRSGARWSSTSGGSAICSMGLMIRAARAASETSDSADSPRRSRACGSPTRSGARRPRRSMRYAQRWRCSTGRSSRRCRALREPPATTCASDGPRGSAAIVTATPPSRPT